MTRRYIFCLAALTILTTPALFIVDKHTPVPARDNPPETHQDALQATQGDGGIDALAADLDKLSADIDALETSQRENIERLKRVSRGEGEILMIATAYSHVAVPGVADINGTGDGVTASGVPVHEGVVAVDPDIIPLGSLVYIVSDFSGVTGYYVAADRGGAIKGLRVDLFMNDRSEAFEFGKRRVRVRVVR